MKQLKCPKCNKEYIFSSLEKKGHTLTRCNSCAVNERRLAFKPKCVSYKGGKCELCGYSKCLDALDFHHINPDEKDFSIAGNHCRAWSKVIAELDKCILVCANCHRELHSTISRK